MAGTNTRINIYLKDKTHMNAKIFSVLRKTTLARFLQESIAQAVDRDKELLKELLR